MRKVTLKEIQTYLQRLGVETNVDFESERIYVVAITAPMEIVLPKREGELYFNTCDRLEVNRREC